MGVNLDRFVRSTITRSTRTVSRRGFGIALLAGYHDEYVDRVREYEDADAMLADGFDARHPLYLAARALKAQSPSPPRFKVGRRAGAPAQVLRFAPTEPEEDELYAVIVGGVTFGVTAGAGDTAADVVDDLVALINPDPDAIIATGASSLSAQLLDGADLDGAIGGGEISPPRNVTLTLSDNVHWLATTAVVTGLDAAGRTITESLAIPSGGDAVVTGERLFARIISFATAIQGGTGGAFDLGLGKRFDADGFVSVTATDGVSHVGIAADTDGAWYGMTASGNIGIQDVTLQPAITLAVDLAAIQAADADWYALHVVDAQSPAQIAAVAAWAEAQTLIHVAHSADTDVTADVESDIATTLAEAEYLRTALVWSRRNHGRFPAAALLGRMLPFTIGAADWEYKALAGILPDDLSPTELTRLTGTPESPLNGKRVNVYIAPRPTGTNTGTPITSGGLVSGGEWIDTVQIVDLTNARLQEVLFNLRISNPKLPYTAAGISMLKGAVLTTLERLAASPHLAYDAASIVVEATELEDTSTADRAARYYNGVRWGARLQGSIRSLTIGGNVTA